MTHHFFSLAGIAGLMLLLTPKADAQAPQSSAWSFDFDAAAVHQSATDLKDGGGDFELDRWFVKAGVTHTWNRSNSLGFAVGAGKSNYVFDQAASFGGGRPWRDIEEFRLSATARFKIGGKGIALLIPTVRFNGESGADSGDSRSYGLFAAAAWRVREGLTIGPGFGLFSRLDDSTRFFPILFIDWDITDRWKLATGRGLAASQGPGVTLSYRLNNFWKLGLAGRYESLEFRLNEASGAPGGIGRDRSFPLVVSAVVDLNSNASFSLFAGLEFAGRLKLKNALNEVIDESDYDPAPIIGVTASLNF